MCESCTGACCAVFPLNVGISYLHEHAAQITDGEKILDMLIALPADIATARAVQYGSHMTGKEKEYFTCRHWDETSRLCGIYPDRPDMCRRFPYGRKCSNPGCRCLGTSPNR